MKYLFFIISFGLFFYTSAQTGANPRLKINDIEILDSAGTNILPTIPLNTAIQYEVDFVNVDVNAVSGYIGLVIRYPSNLTDTLVSVEDSVYIPPHTDTTLHYHDFTDPARYSGGGGVVVVVVWPAYSESPIFLHSQEEETELQILTSLSAVQSSEWVSLAPNPVAEILHLHYPDNVETVSVSLLNYSGQLIFYSEQKLEVLSFEGIPSGLYRLIFRRKTGEIYSVPVVRE
ncbi:MAG: hypothetical protein K1X92_05515 [Bacteroidia bacterium]|nr:hypothetical protein [Bacteroidia bacterium]